MAIGIIEAASPLVNGLFGLIDDLFTSDEERDAAKIRILELEKSGELAQLAVNAKEAEHDSLFVAGWRPFIGWVCGLAFAWAFLIYPALTFVTVAYGLDIPLDEIPTLDLSTMMPVLLGMLGLGGLRSWEKKQGVARTNINGVDRRANAGD